MATNPTSQGFVARSATIARCRILRLMAHGALAAPSFEDALADFAANGRAQLADADGLVARCNRGGGLDLAPRMPARSAVTAQHARLSQKCQRAESRAEQSESRLRSVTNKLP